MHFLNKPFSGSLYIFLLLYYQIIATEKNTEVCVEKSFLKHAQSDECGRPWPAAYINFNQYIHQIQVLTKPLCLAHAIFYLLPNN